MNGNPSSLVEVLQSFTPERLTYLLEHRPDLAADLVHRGRPASLTDLATAVRSERSLGACLTRLPQAPYRALEAIVALGHGAPVDLHDLACNLSTDAQSLAAPLAELAALCLISGPDPVTPTPGVRHLIPVPAGLGPRIVDVFARRAEAAATALTLVAAAAPHAPGHSEPAPSLTAPAEALAAHLSPVALDAIVDRLGPASQLALRRMARGGPLHHVPDSPALRALVEHGLLVVTNTARDGDDHTLFVVMPREVALALRGNVYDGLGTEPRPGSVAMSEAPASVCYDLVRRVNLVRVWDDAPPAALRSGGVPVREIKRAANLFECDEAAAALLWDLLALAGYASPDDGEWLLTSEYFEAATQSDERRWAELAATWVASPLAPGETPATLASPARPAGGATSVPDAATLRRCVLDAWVVPCTPDLTLARAHYLHPFVASHLTPDLVRHVTAEALALGVAYSDGENTCLTPWGRALQPWHLDETAAAVALAAAAPPLVDEVVVQGDLTVIVPGRPSPALAPLLDWVRIESRGGAVVARFTADSVRVAVAAGRDADDLLAMLREHCPTPLPQPLEYLVRDAARLATVARVGRVTTYLRGAESLLDEISASPQCAALMAWRIAPTVLVSTRETAQVAGVLRELGVTTQVEGPGGQVLDLASARPRPRPLHAALQRRGDLDLKPLVEQLSGSGADRGSVGSVGTVSTVGSVASALEAAQATDSPVQLGVVDAQGHTSQRTVRVVWVQAGRASLRDEGTGEVTSVPLHRLRLGE